LTLSFLINGTIRFSVRTQKRINAERRQAMQKIDFKNIEFLWGIGLLVIGFSLFVALDSIIRYVGIVFIILAIALFVRLFFSNVSNSGDENFKSRTREQIQRHQHRN